MPAPSRSADDWDALIDQYLAVAPTTSQRLFCEQRGISFDAFRNQYQKSPKFAGKRRRPGASRADARAAGTATNAAAGAERTFAFRTARTPDSSLCSTSPAVAPVVVRVHDRVSVECRAGADPVAVAALVRELVR